MADHILKIPNLETQISLVNCKLLVLCYLLFVGPYIFMLKVSNALTYRFKMKCVESWLNYPTIYEDDR